MRVFKFGGASVRDAAACVNVRNILQKHEGENLVVVISAMGKTTNALEEVFRCWVDDENYQQSLELVVNYHREILNVLRIDAPEMDASRVDELFAELESILKNKPSRVLPLEYDRIVAFGELLSTAIVCAFLEERVLPVDWVDVRHIIRTNSNHQQAEVDWEESAQQSAVLKSHFETHPGGIVITQGFIAADSLGNTTTLGREGSDYSGAILAYLLDAEDLTIWKDVPGMLNADPKWFENTVRLPKISFREAIELSYYGASVIHPKTIQPLQNKGIPLYVRSFMNPENEGSVIQESDEYDTHVPSYIFKPDQWLVSISPRDFSFIVEEHLTEIFKVLNQLGIKINLMQNSAISFSIAIDGNMQKIDELITRLSTRYRVRYNSGLQLMTIRHYDENVVKLLTMNKEVLLDQRSRSTLRMLLREKQ